MTRQGFMIYHEDGKMLKYADDATLANVIRNLIDFSIRLEESEEIPQIENGNGMEKALYDSMVQKIIRDSEKYADVVRENSIKRKIGHLQNFYKANGIKKSKEAIRLEAEDWYTKEYCGKPGNSNCNVTETVTETQTETITPTTTITRTVSERNTTEAEAATVAPKGELQNIILAAESRGVRITDKVICALSEELQKSSESEVIQKMIGLPSFLQRLKMLGGTA